MHVKHRARVARKLQKGGTAMATITTQNTAVCANCETTTQYWIEHDGNKYCKECYSEIFHICEDCGYVYHSDEMRVIDNAYICDYCFEINWTRCDSCNRYLNLTIDTVLTANDFTYCEDCYYEIYTVCSLCGEHIYRDEAYCLDEQDVCESCYREHRVIRDYSYKPSPIFTMHYKKMKRKLAFESEKYKSLLFLGVELEVENIKNLSDTNSVAAEVIEEFGIENLYLKCDGSLNNGFEIVTHPVTLQGHKSKKVIDWDKLLKILLDRGFRSFNPGTCGLHVHVNRSQFLNTKDIYELKLAGIMLKLNQFIRKVSGRSNFNYCEMIDNDCTITNVRNCRADIANSRYYAINLMPLHTVEFRFPRGTLKYDSFIGTLELVAILVEIVNRYGLAYIMRKLTVNDVVQIARQNQYKYIFKLFDARGVELCA